MLFAWVGSKNFGRPLKRKAEPAAGIMRDVFTMGARPIANLNSIHFGSPQHKKTKNLLKKPRSEWF